MPKRCETPKADDPARQEPNAAGPEPTGAGRRHLPERQKPKRWETEKRTTASRKERNVRPRAPPAPERNRTVAAPATATRQTKLKPAGTHIIPQIAHKAVAFEPAEPQLIQFAKHELANQGRRILGTRGSHIYIAPSQAPKARRLFNVLRIVTHEAPALVFEDFSWLPATILTAVPLDNDRWAAPATAIRALWPIETPPPGALNPAITPKHPPFTARADVQEIMASWVERFHVRPLAIRAGRYNVVIEAGIKEDWGTLNYAYLADLG